jgi:hypothetical protein
VNSTVFKGLFPTRFFTSSHCRVPDHGLESGHLWGRNIEFSHVGKGRRTLTLLIRIEIVQGAGRAQSSDSELARPFVSNGTVVLARAERTSPSASAPNRISDIGSATCCDKPSMSHHVACDVGAGSIDFARC